MDFAQKERPRMTRMKNVLFRFVAVSMALTVEGFGKDEPSVIVAVGAGGSDAYAGAFAEWAGHWQEAATKAGAKLVTVGMEAEEKDPVAKLAAAVSEQPAQSTEPLWLVMLGHGTATGGEAKFNLRGTDVAAAKVAEWLKPLKRPVVVVCAFSTSGAWLKLLSAPGRVVVTATRSASESNFARFGGKFSKAIADPAADLDQDGQTSVLEAYISGSRATAEWYAQEGRLATEHALLDDNGDGAGTPADWFVGVRAVKKPKEGQADGARAHQIHLVRSSEERALPPDVRARRDELERELAALRERKAEVVEEEYYRKLEEIFTELARLYRRR
jgi:hypothetical protein